MPATWKGLLRIFPNVLVLIYLFSCNDVEKMIIPKTKYGCDYGHFDLHQLGDLESVTDLPSSQRLKLERFLKGRLGKSLYQLLRFAGGKVGPSDPEVRADLIESLKGDGSNPYINMVYYLYLLLLADDGSEGYCAELVLDAEGTPLGESVIPNAARLPERAGIITRKEAVAIALAQGAPAENLLAEIMYSQPCDCLEWVVSFPERRVGNRVWRAALHVNAHEPSRLWWSRSELMF